MICRNGEDPYVRAQCGDKLEGYQVGGGTASSLRSDSVVHRCLPRLLRDPRHWCWTSLLNPLAPAPLPAQVAVAVMQRMAVPEGESATAQAKVFAKALHDKWGVGDAACNNGVLLLLSVQDRQVRAPAALEGVRLLLLQLLLRGAHATHLCNRPSTALISILCPSTHHPL